MIYKMLVAILIFAGLLFGCSTKSNYQYEGNIMEGEGTQQSDTAKNSTITISTDIKEIIEDTVGDYKDNIAVYYYTVNGSEEYYLNKDDYFTAASLKKVPQALQALDKVNSGELALDQILDYDAEVDYEEGTGVLQYYEIVEPVTLNEAIELSIIYSDNIANNMIARVCGNDLNKYIEQITGEDNLPTGNKTTAQQQFKIYKRIYENPENNEQYQAFIELLKSTEFHDRLDKYLPDEVVAHKIGNYFRYYHDAGIIYTEEPYILIVLTKDVGQLNYEVADNDERNLLDWGEEACEMIATISKNIYDMIASR